MTLSFGHFTVLLLYLVLTYAKKGRDSVALDRISQDDELYEVIKNITHFNSVLQVLIDKFNNLYKSQELTFREYDTDTGDDISNGVLRNMDLKTDHPYYQGTSMFFAEEKLANSEKPREHQPTFVETITDNNKTHIKPKKIKKYISEETNFEEKSSKSKSDRSISKKHIFKTETFRSNIWHDIVANKPINLKTQKEIEYNEKNVPGVRRQPSTLKKKEGDMQYINNKFNYYPLLSQRVDSSRRRMHDLQIPRKPMISAWKLEPDRSVIQELKKVKKSRNGEILKTIFTADKTWSSNNDKVKTTLLRQAYGEACLKVVIKKCYKACKEAEKKGCRAAKCSSKFRSSMKRMARTGCIRQFSNSSNSNNKNKGIYEDDEDLFTRSRYIDCACLPLPIYNERQGGYLRDGRRRMNILRDRFEKACQQESGEKCEHACYFAVNAACMTVGCGSSMKNTLKKACKNACKNGYSSYGSSKKWRSSSSSSSGSGSSESGSDSSSGSDSGSCSRRGRSRRKSKS